MRTEAAAPHFVGLDIGTSTVRCVIGTRDEHTGVISVIGHGSAPNQGMRKGVIMHVDDSAEAIVQAVTEAERIAGIRVERATINVNGAHVTGMNSRGVIAISTANREITVEDRERVEEAAAIVKLPANREILQVFAKNYRLDGQDNLKDPVGMRGVRLEVDCHIVTAATPNVRNLDLALEKAQVTIANRTVSALAAAEATLDRKQKEAGTVVLDIGAGTTNLTVIEDGEIQHVAVIPMGGTHITNDLAIGLKTDLDVAEQVKLKHARLGDTTDKTFRIIVDGVGHTFEQLETNMIVEARVEELFEFVDKELQRIHRSRKLPGGVVIVGGTASLPGIADFAKEKLELPARLGKIKGLEGLVDTVDDPSFVTGTGLMLLDVIFAPFAVDQVPPTEMFSGNIQSLSKLFKKFKP
ncbi:cell division protein FtsA [Candidatus Saccharibacteria bacterium]|jgi:cell division protein FtsA|nr:cell division protein FtsA [Candidatus Saccharibacteria bacterium]HPR09723.1 cell division protein FtsA [Candidatus Saccharibacteria bacterium]